MGIPMLTTWCCSRVKVETGSLWTDLKGGVAWCSSPPPSLELCNCPGQHHQDMYICIWSFFYSTPLPKMQDIYLHWYIFHLFCASIRLSWVAIAFVFPAISLSIISETYYRGCHPWTGTHHHHQDSRSIKPCSMSHDPARLILFLLQGDNIVCQPVMCICIV